tara:strand:+ start:16197 stop:16964 length:768 start_codon:yes stop_codon:yes gene_type:complete
MTVVSKKKLAVLMCGHLRTYKKCLKNFKSTIVEANKEDYDIDIFVVTSNVVAQREHGPVIKPSSILKGSKKHPTVYKVNVEETTAELVECYKPASVTFIEEDFDKYNSYAVNEWSHFKYGIYLKPYLAMKKVKDKQEEEGFRYDAVLRTRPDVTYRVPVKINDLEENTIYLPGGWVKNPERYDDDVYHADVLAYGDFETMNKYTNIHKMDKPLPSKLNAEWSERSENQLYLYLKHNKINIKYCLKQRRDYKVERK